MTVYELAVKLTRLIGDGYGDKKIYLDTEACKFDFHYGEIDSVDYLDEEHVPDDDPFISLLLKPECYVHNYENSSPYRELSKISVQKYINDIVESDIKYTNCLECELFKKEYECCLLNGRVLFKTEGNRLKSCPLDLLT